MGSIVCQCCDRDKRPEPVTTYLLALQDAGKSTITAPISQITILNENDSLDDLKTNFLKEIEKIQDPIAGKYDCAVLIGAYNLAIEQIIFNCRLSER